MGLALSVDLDPHAWFRQTQDRFLIAQASALTLALNHQAIRSVMGADFVAVLIDLISHYIFVAN